MLKSLFLKALPLLCSGSVFFSAYGQAWTIYTTGNSSLPSDIVWCVEVDRSTNEKWIGTDWGLAKFDGSTWTIYNTSNSGLPHNSVRSLALDENNDLWAGTLSGGLAKFDGSTWTVYTTSNSGIPDDFIKAVAFDTAGYLWVGTPSGFGKYDWNTWTIWDVNNTTLWSHHITCIRIGNDNIKRLGTLNGGLLYFNDTTFTVYSFWDGNFPENSIASIDIDSSGKPWVATASSGLDVHLGGPAWNWMNTSNSLIPSDVLNHIRIDQAQNKYLCSQNKGFLTYINNTWAYYDSTNSGFPDSWATQSVKDTAGILWIGTLAQGLVRLDESQLNGQEEPSEEYIHIGPIPTPDLFTITLEKPFSGTWYIVDPLGTIISKTPAHYYRMSYEFDISTLSAGNYYLFGKYEDGKQIIKRIIKI